MIANDEKEEDLKEFRQWGSKTPGHPENFETPGIEVTTGQISYKFCSYKKKISGNLFS